MPTFKIKGTDILHSKTIYPEGTTIQLEEADAIRLADYLELIYEPETPKQKEVKQAKQSRPKTQHRSPKEAKTEDTSQQQTKAPVDSELFPDANKQTPVITEVKTQEKTQIPPAAKKVIANAITQVNSSIHSYQPSAPTNMRPS